MTENESQKEDKGFLIIKSTYRVRCRNCLKSFYANMGKHPITIQMIEHGGEEYCPVCGHLALVAWFPDEYNRR